MITIPDSIKALLKQDNVLKNFRVVFPNGERADIVNAQIVRESMKFDESLVSRVPVKFGLCEANVISFQCVGIENIKRKIIHVQMELDISSLSAAEQAQYGQTSTDVPFTYYVLHYGTFLVTSCERDSAINLRKVVGTSYGLSGSGEYVIQMNDACDYDKRKLGYFTYSASKSTSYFNLTNYLLLQGQDIFDYHTVGGSYVNIDDISTDRETWGVEGTNGPNFLVKPKNPADHAYVDEDGYCLLSMHAEIKKYDVNLAETTSDNPLFEVGNLNMIVPTDEFMHRAKEAWSDFLYFMENTYELDTMWEYGTGLHKWEIIKKFIYNLFFSMMLAQYWDAENNTTTPSQTTYTSTYVPETSKFLPMNKYVMAHREWVCVPDIIRIYVDEFTTSPMIASPETTLKFFAAAVKGSDYWHRKYSFTSENVTFLPVKFKTITTQQVKIGNATRYTPAIPIAEIGVKTTLQDMLELQGKFGGLGRDGTFRKYTLLDGTLLFPSEEIYPSDTLYPCTEVNSAQIGTGEFISAKWDEGIFYYKGIYAAYKDTNGDDAEYRVLFDEDDDNPDMPYYNISSNSFISGGRYTEAQLIALIADLVAVLRNFRYYSSDVSMRALPNIEIGDTLYLRTQNDTIVTPVFTQTITGIQDLRAKIVSR